MKFRFASLLETAKSIQAQKGLGFKEALGEASRLLESSLSFGEVETLIRNWLRTNCALGAGDYIYRYPRAVYPESFVFEVCDSSDVDRLYLAPYSLGENNSITVGTPVEVRAEVRYVPVASLVSESKRRLRETYLGVLRESADGDGHALVKIIDPGPGSSCYYPASALQSACEAGLFSPGIQMFTNHMTDEERKARPEGDVKNLFAVTVEEGKWLDDGPDGPAVYAKSKIFAHQKPFVESVWQDVGLSIDAWGAMYWGEMDGQEQWIMDEFLAINSIDMVTKAGRGGKIVSLQEAARDWKPEPPTPAQTAPAQPSAKPIQENQLPDSAQNPGGSNPTETKEVQELTEEEAKKQTETAVSEAKRVAVANYQNGHKVALEALSGLNLPAASRARVVEAELVKLPLTESGALDTEAFKTQVKDAAEREALYAKEAFGYGDGGVHLPPADATKPAKESKGVSPELSGHLQRLY